LSDEKKREALDAALKQARIDTLKALSLPTTITNDDYRFKEVESTFKEKLRTRSKQILIEEEARRRLWVTIPNLEVPPLIVSSAIKVNLANEGTEQRMKEAEVAMKKRKAEDDARWEGNASNYKYTHSLNHVRQRIENLE
jgi:DnaJ homolog subfamily C member 8